MPRDLSTAQARLMDLLCANPDWTNDRLAHVLGYSVGYVEQLMSGVFAVYRVQSRTGAVVTHLRRHGSRRRREAQTETLGLA